MTTAPLEKPSWIGIASELGGAFTDGLALQAQSLADDSTVLVEGWLRRIAFGLAAALLLLCALMFASLAIAALFAPTAGWPMALGCTAVAHGAAALVLIVIGQLRAKSPATAFAKSHQIFTTLRQCMSAPPGHTA